MSGFAWVYGACAETVYGLGADALNESAIERVFALKGRPKNNPMIVHAADEAMARTVVASWPERADRLGDRFGPGPLTLCRLDTAPGPGGRTSRR